MPACCWHDAPPPPRRGRTHDQADRPRADERPRAANGRRARSGLLGANGREAHPWIRSYEGGWRVLYDGISSKKKHRELAHRAVAALGLDFGAVDIGEAANGTLTVLEVNRAPGIEGGTVDAYAKALKGLMGAV